MDVSDSSPKRGAHPWIETVGPHLHVQRYPKQFTSAELHEFLAAVEEFIYALPSPYAWVVDIGGMAKADREQRQAITALGERTATYARANSAGTAIVAPNAILRALVKTTYLVNKPPFEVKVVASIDEGVRWARAQLAARGV